MKIVWNYIFILTGTAILLQLAGIQIGGLTQLFNLIGITFNQSAIKSISSNPSFWNAIFGSGIGILIGVGIGVIIGFFTRATPENFIILPFITGTLTIYVSAIYSIITYSTSFGWVGVVIAAILLPYAISLIAALVDYFRGGDF
ncbi:MAG: hypothetical protein ABSG05_03510 [Candidatus Pacearchaeota archaeon]|jgi:hypothetical protein